MPRAGLFVGSKHCCYNVIIRQKLQPPPRSALRGIPLANDNQSVDYVTYLQMRTKDERLSVLSAMAKVGNYLPISLAEDLLVLDITHDEKLAILERTSSRDNLALEHFLTHQVANAPQELAATALRLWSQTTQNLLWFRMLQVVQSPLLSQRLFYTIIDLALNTGGERIINASLKVDGIEDMSTALHGLILHRACQWNIQNDRLYALAHNCLNSAFSSLHPDNKAIPSAMAYLGRFHVEDIEGLINRRDFSEPWSDFARVIVFANKNQSKSLTRLNKLLHSSDEIKAQQIEALWPALWNRSELTAKTIAAAIRLYISEFLARDGKSETVFHWDHFAGISTTVLQEALELIDDDKIFANALSCLSGLMPSPASPQMLEVLRQRLTKAADPSQLLSNLPLRLRLDLTDEGPQRTGNIPFAAVKKEQQGTLNVEKVVFKSEFHDYSRKDGTTASASSGTFEDPTQLIARKQFFRLAYLQQEVPQVSGDDFFSLLTETWKSPTEQKLARLSTVSRQVDGILKLCYINTLGRFKGHDAAVLKLMDFVRSPDRNYLLAVIHALGDIGTPRSAQELIASLTRPNITAALQIEVCTALKKLDLTNLQNELHAAINDLSSQNQDEKIAQEVREMVVSLLQTSLDNRPVKEASASAPRVEVSDARLDQELGGKIPNYRELSSEVKRALRTAQFFHIQTTGASAPSSIDLSPVIDMQYKSLELLFRETYEEPCSALIHAGVLQRRLDIIGYARPIPRAMDEFEHFIETLPVVREIPFFSNFKLRKMLRAICQFRPGRRFTLDGLKAFALFFLCFSRKDCQYGLSNLFPLGFPSDADVFQFCKSLHVFQDFRNRAAHEGFHPDAANDIDGIWRMTAEIVQIVFHTKKALELPPQRDSAQSRDRGQVIIEKKVS